MGACALGKARPAIAGQFHGSTACGKHRLHLLKTTKETDRTILKHMRAPLSVPQNSYCKTQCPQHARPPTGTNVQVRCCLLPFATCFRIKYLSSFSPDGMNHPSNSYCTMRHKPCSIYLVEMRHAEMGCVWTARTPNTTALSGMRSATSRTSVEGSSRCNASMAHGLLWLTLVW